MKALIIGGAGFVGGYLIDYLTKNLKWDVSVTKLATETIDEKNCNVYNLDILNLSKMKELIQEINPDYIFHLAAQSSVSVSWQKPNLTVDVNINGCINLLEAVRSLKINPRVLLVGSAEEYGKINNDINIVKESQSICPSNIYAATKACQNMIGKIYSDAYDMDIVMARSFNHFGPKQAPIFVVADFCKQVAEIEKNLKEPIIRVGNLSVFRDFTDVRDIVRAYSLLIQKGIKGETYNVGSGKATEIKTILSLILEKSKCEIKIEKDKNKFRPVDVPVIQADISKIINITGWSPQIDIRTTIEDTLNYWRSVIK